MSSSFSSLFSASHFKPPDGHGRRSTVARLSLLAVADRVAQRDPASVVLTLRSGADSRQVQGHRWIRLIRMIYPLVN